MSTYIILISKSSLESQVIFTAVKEVLRPTSVMITGLVNRPSSDWLTELQRWVMPGPCTPSKDPGPVKVWLQPNVYVKWTTLLGQGCTNQIHSRYLNWEGQLLQSGQSGSEDEPKDSSVREKQPRHGPEQDAESRGAPETHQELPLTLCSRISSQEEILCFFPSPRIPVQLPT